MFRKLTLVSAVSLALLPGVAGALRLGGIGTESALNEPFSGQIELADLQPDELASVAVRLASEAEFNKVGAPRSGFLSQLSFRTAVSSEGQAIIQVTSKEPVREPYLDFLIEVTWPNGRLVQEYTVLLDPPVTVDSAPPQVVQPAIAAVESPPTARSEPPPSSPSPPQSLQAPVSQSATAFPLRYGPIESGAGLWRIARKMAKSGGATVEQTAMALYRNNQHAFIRGDINKLKIGEILEIPTGAELAALDEASAGRQFQAALRGEKVPSTPLTDITAAPPPADRLQIAGSVEPTTGQEGTRSDAPAETSAGRELASDASADPPAASGEDESPIGTTPEFGGIEQDLLLVQEASESARQETAELRNRVLELETQLADIQRLLKLSNERFAQLQSAGLSQTGVKETEESAQSLPSASDETDQATAGGERTEIAAGSTPDVAVVATEPQALVEASVGESGQTSSQEPADTPFWESIPSHIRALALAVPILVLAFGWMIYRRRKSLEAPLSSADFMPDTQEISAASGIEKVASDAEETTEGFSVSPSSVSSYSGFEHLEDETEEADIISEADVYIAYGRYREAESLLEEEIQKSPDRSDIKYKLAEAYYGARNQQGLRSLMDELQSAGGDLANPEQWQRLRTMLQNLEGPDAGQPLSDAGRDGPSGDPKAPGSESRIVSPFPAPDPLGRESAPGISTPDLGVEADSSLPASDLQDRLSQDLELEVDDLDAIAGNVDTPPSEAALEMSGAASDLELQLEDLDSLRDLDLANFTNRVGNAGPPTEESPAPHSTDVDADSLDITPVGKDSLASDVLSSHWQMDSGLWDEVATKIDLARAYMEMEDPEAARVILEEVIEEGNDGQRAEAQEMMAQLA